MSFSYFNSIKVRLEPNLGQVNVISWSFQFHKGAIRTTYFYHNFRMYIVFQFHKGAIRTVLDKLSIKPLLYFNSIKVRLELKRRE